MKDTAKLAMAASAVMSFVSLVKKFKHSKLNIPSALCHRIRIFKDSAQPQPRMRITALSKAGGDVMGAGIRKGVVKGTRQERV